MIVLLNWKHSTKLCWDKFSVELEKMSLHSEARYCAWP